MQLDTASLTSPSHKVSPPTRKNLEDSKKNEAASKIQTWYRDNQYRRQNEKQDEIRRLEIYYQKSLKSNKIYVFFLDYLRKKTPKW